MQQQQPRRELLAVQEDEAKSEKGGHDGEGARVVGVGGGYEALEFVVPEVAHHDLALQLDVGVPVDQRRSNVSIVLSIPISKQEFYQTNLEAMSQQGVRRLLYFKAYVQTLYCSSNQTASDIRATLRLVLGDVCGLSSAEVITHGVKRYIPV